MNEVHQAVTFAHGLGLGAFLASFFFIVGRWCEKR
jgi:hypothetical protein